MSDFVVIMTAVLIFIGFTEYLYTNIGDMFTDAGGTVYRVTEKNFLIVKMSSEFDDVTVPLVTLRFLYGKLE